MKFIKLPFFNKKASKRKARKKRSLPRWFKRVRRYVLTGIITFLVLSLLVVVPFRWLNPPTTSFMLRTDANITHVWVSIDEIAPELALAVIASEDQRFLEHHGFDIKQITKALEDHKKGKKLRGASTISQQVTKNMYLWPGRSYVRKALESWLTLLIELTWSKSRIMEVYLNIVQFDANVFGAEAAARKFFAIPATQLSREQAALLAVALPAPSRYHVETPSAYMRERQLWTLRQMKSLGGVSFLAGM